MTLPLRAILFDKDGTLVDFAVTWNGATSLAIAELSGGDEPLAIRLANVVHFDLPTASLLRSSPFIAGTVVDLVPLWAAEVGVPADERFYGRVRELFHRGALDFVMPIGDPVGVLTALKAQDYLLGIVTNDSEASARAQSEKLGMAGLFDAILGHDSGHGHKPAPDPILEFLRRFALQPGEVAMVGDTMHDLDSARAAGVLSIGVASGYLSAEQLAPHADHVIGSIMELAVLLDVIHGVQAPMPSR